MSQQNKIKAAKFNKQRILRRVGYVVIAGLIWFAQQKGWLNNTDVNNQVSNQQSQHQSNNRQNSSRQSSKKYDNSSVKIQEPITVTRNNATKSNDNDLIAKLYQQGKSDEIVTAVGRVGKILPDDNKGSRHQKFLLDIGQKKWLLIAHNIDLAPYVPLKQGDDVIVHGEYEYNEKGGVIHWTHHDPRGYHEEGYIEHNGKRYK